MFSSISPAKTHPLQSKRTPCLSTPDTKPPLPSKQPDIRDTEKCDSIKVAIRLRPLKNGSEPAWGIIPETNSIEHIDTPKDSQKWGRTLFACDKAFNEDSTTQEVYNGIATPIVRNFVTGHDGTIFAYGQTSSGKTYTMQGDLKTNENQQLGIIQMAACDIFSHIKNSPDREFLIRVSYIEIYNEQVRDLLSGTREKPTILAVREDPKRGVFVDCNEAVVTDSDGLVRMLAAGEKNRVVSSTNMNSESSRSHTIFRITMESREKVDRRYSIDDCSAVLISTLNLVDLAGSECVRSTGATGQRQREGGKINQSLLALSQVINEIGQQNKKHISFRNSKLTRILQSSLSGNSLMAVICCATASIKHTEETRSTLKFAARAKLVKTNAVKNEVIDDRALIKRLERELKDAKKELSEHKEERQLGNAAKDVAEQKMNRLKSMILRGGMWKDDLPTPKTGGKTNIPLAALISPSVKKGRHWMGNFNLDNGLISPTSPLDLNFFVGDLHVDNLTLDMEEEADGTTTRRVERQSSLKYIPDNNSSEISILKEALTAKCDLTRDLKAVIEEREETIKTLTLNNNKLTEKMSDLAKEKDMVIKSLLDEIDKKTKAHMKMLKANEEAHKLTEQLSKERAIETLRSEYEAKLDCLQAENEKRIDKLEIEKEALRCKCNEWVGVEHELPVDENRNHLPFMHDIFMKVRRMLKIFVRKKKSIELRLM